MLSNHCQNSKDISVLKDKTKEKFRFMNFLYGWSPDGLKYKIHLSFKLLIVEYIERIGAYRSLRH